MKQIKTYFFLLTAVFFLIFTGKTIVLADLIFEPQDSFYELHKDECSECFREFTAAGPNGAVTVWKSPQSQEKEGSLENETVISISFLYTDDRGLDWGICETSEISGWIPMDYLQLVYDEISFEEDYAEQISDREGTVILPEDGYVVFWEYPGSPDSYEYQCENGSEPAYSSLYQDNEGRNWGCCIYYYGLKNYWICLDDPGASPEELYPEGLPAAGAGKQQGGTGEETDLSQTSGTEAAAGTEAVTGTETETPEKEGPEMEKEITPDNSAELKIAGICAGLVLVLAGITILLLRKMKRR